MSVKKTGSKLAQGVHQIKTQLDPALLPMASVGASVEALSTIRPERVVAAPASVRSGGAHILHPKRIWPD